MPRKSEPSFDLKLIIWDIAATISTDNYSAVYREVERKIDTLRSKGEIFEDTPDERKIWDIVELDIQRLHQEVVIANLPRHVWHLRHDYEEIKSLHEDIQDNKPRVLNDKEDSEQKKAP